MLDLEKYRIQDGKTPLNAATLNERFYSIVRRLHDLEQLKTDWETAVSEIQNAGIDRINGAVQPLVDDLNSQFDTQKQSWDDLMDDAEPLVDNWTTEHNPDGTHGDVDLSSSVDFTTGHNPGGSHKALDFDLSNSDHFRTEHNGSGGHELIGHISGLTISVKDADEISVDAGVVDLSGGIYRSASQFSKQLSGLSVSTVYHVYIKPPVTGRVVSATEIEADTTAPVYDSSKAAGYHPTNTTWRWLGWSETDASGNLKTVESVQSFNSKAVGELETHLVRESASFGRIELDGSEVSRSTYADLYRYLGEAYGSGDGSTTFDLPDLRGRFLRVWDHGAGFDPDAGSRTDRGDGTTGDKPGTLQADQYKSHTHNHNINTALSTSSGSYNYQTSSGTKLFQYVTFQNSGGNETRPGNIAVAVFCKYIGRL